jgi:hypothetical protein
LCFRKKILKIFEKGAFLAWFTFFRNFLFKFFQRFC